FVHSDGACLNCGGHSDSETPQDLTLWNFFSAGWGEEFTPRASGGRAPGPALLRGQTNLKERGGGVNYFHQHNINNSRRENLDSLDAFIAYAFNRRFMFEVLANYSWVDARDKIPDFDGSAARLVGRVQLISTANSSYSFNFQTISP